MPEKTGLPTSVLQEGEDRNFDSHREFSSEEFLELDVEMQKKVIKESLRENSRMLLLVRENLQDDVYKVLMDEIVLNNFQQYIFGTAT